MSFFSTTAKKQQAFKKPKSKAPKIGGFKAKVAKAKSAAAGPKAKKGGFGKMSKGMGKAPGARKKATPPPIGPKRKKPAAPQMPGGIPDMGLGGPPIGPGM